MGDLVQMIGEAFARLTVTAKAPEYIDGSGRKRLKYLCSCTCGKTVEVLGENLRSGHTTSCGCLQDENRKKLRVTNLVGDRYGRLTVIGEAAPYVSPRGVELRRVKVRCDCENEIELNLNSLRSGISASCGCFCAGSAC